MASSPTTRSRPALFRALGDSGPPERVTVGGSEYTLHNLYKHDSWAATGLYRNKTQSIICKFNRQQPIFGFSTAWLGRLLADNERMALESLADVPGVPRSLGDVFVNGKRWPNAIAREFIAGHPLGAKERVSPRFFTQLRETLAAMHARNIAYVDLHKRENIIVGEGKGQDGRPYFVDFQICLDASRTRTKWIPGINALFDCLRQSDNYHVAKHIDRYGGGNTIGTSDRPWWITLHRSLAVPYRQLRRRLLVQLKIRSGAGYVESERFIEDAFRKVA